MEYTISSFVDRLLEEKGVSNLPPKVVEQMKSDLHERAEDLVNAEVLSAMPKDKLEEFEAKLDSGSEDDIQAFCKSHIPNLDEVVAGALLKLRNKYLTA